ncbi:PTS sugar transporter subunit IIA [uncultured Gulosibacter sp.]|uniref:PTS sugar transporter subunit IIA n=1 Tax=uncultured Gulosibacter sp. TaxID=1339167 RepID=UPI00288A32CE|nr:PTS sugar transporter subunit IIA [uncultured Gulosibacter sp.]
MTTDTRIQVHFDEHLVRLGSDATTWQDAVTQAGDLLVQAGCARQGYQRRLISVIDRFGPYMVIAPNLALVHAQPGPDVVRNGLSAVTLPDGVNFGHPHFDPVGLVVGITTVSSAQHLGVIAAVATALEHSPELVGAAVRSKQPEKLVALLRAELPMLDLHR